MGRMKDLFICIHAGGDDAIEAANELVDLHRWIPIEEREPPLSRVLAVKQMPNGHRSIDLMVWVPEPDSGLPPLPSKTFVTHWMPIPEFCDET
jgi:hypothetical protein